MTRVVLELPDGKELEFDNAEVPRPNDPIQISNRQWQVKHILWTADEGGDLWVTAVLH